MKIRTIWEKNDIKLGKYIIRESSKKNPDNIGFAASVTYQMARQGNGKGRRYYLVSICDGMMFHKCRSKDKMAEILNMDDKGYRLLLLDEHIAIMKYLARGE